MKAHSITLAAPLLLSLACAREAETPTPSPPPPAPAAPRPHARHGPGRHANAVLRGRNIPALETVRLLVDFRPRDGAAGAWMLHCHILEHAERGMMAEVRVR